MIKDHMRNPGVDGR